MRSALNSFRLSAIVALNYLQTTTFAVAFQTTTMSMSTSTSTPKSVLYDMPVSNNGARCRIILYKKKIPKSEVDVVSPLELGGGLRSPEYLERNPQGKMPMLSLTSTNADDCSGGITNIYESDTICRFLLSKYNDVQEYNPSLTFLPNNARSNLISRIHDMYLTTIQSCMYKATPPFGIYGTRSDALKEYGKQLNVINDLIDDSNADDSIQYLCGNEVSLADATLFPSIIFAEKMLPKFGIENPLPEKVLKWYNQVKAKDEDFAKVYDEVAGGIEKWEANNRWDPIFLAGVRDDDPPTIFDKIINGEIPSTIVYDDEKVLAFKDINPAAPAHILVIPKDRMGLSGLRKASPDHVEILGQLLVAAAEVAKDESLGFTDGGARIVINDGSVAGQEVPHLHVHVLGGRDFAWPPG